VTQFLAYIFAQCPCSGAGGGSGGGMSQFAWLTLFALAFGLWQAVKWTRATWNTERTSTMSKFAKTSLAVMFVAAMGVVVGSRSASAGEGTGPEDRGIAETSAAPELVDLGSKANSSTQPAAAAKHKPNTVAQAYPNLASEALAHALPATLPEGILLRAGKLTVTQKEVDAEIGNAPEAVREQLRTNALFLLEQMATRRLLQQEARSAAAKDGGDADRLSDQELLKAYFGKLTADVKVSDAEMAEFHRKNKAMVGGQPLEAVKESIANYLQQQKQQQVVNEHVRTLGQRMKIEIDAAWLKTQAELARDNPVDKARASGKPSLVDFGAKGCIPCDKLAPILAAMRTKYDGKANVVFVSVREQQILAFRYGIRSIPVQIFFDKDGREVFRHTGFWPQEQLEKKLAELRVE